MEEINSLLELERLERAYIDKALQSEQEEDYLDEVKFGDLSEQVIGDMVQKMLSTVRGQRKGRRDTNTRRVPFPICINNLCGCIDDTTQEEGSSSWGTSVMDMTLEDDDYSSFRDSWSGEFSNVEIDKKSFRTGKIFSSNKSQGSKFSKIPKWKKVLGRGERCEC